MDMQCLLWSVIFVSPLKFPTEAPTATSPTPSGEVAETSQRVLVSSQWDVPRRHPKPQLVALDMKKQQRRKHNSQSPFPFPYIIFFTWGSTPSCTPRRYSTLLWLQTMALIWRHWSSSQLPHTLVKTTSENTTQ